MNLACVFYCSLVEEEEKKKDDKGEKDKVEAGKSKREAIQVSVQTSWHTQVQSSFSLAKSPVSASLMR